MATLPAHPDARCGPEHDIFAVGLAASICSAVLFVFVAASTAAVLQELAIFGDGWFSRLAFGLANLLALSSYSLASLKPFISFRCASGRGAVISRQRETA